MTRDPEGVTMPTNSTQPPTTDALLAELRELCTDVTGDQRVRARRLAVLRRLERRMAGGDPASRVAVA